MSDLSQHCLAIERCNQRGGRMLSIVDLLEAETLSRELAVYLVASIRSGASFMVGALPGGAGKTTVMGALLNFVPSEVKLYPADGLAAIEQGARTTERGCYVCHEIGSGHYYAYLWGKALRAYFALTEHGHILATNLHADTFPQARRQVCEENGVPEANFRQMNLILFLRVPGGWSGKRELIEVWESNGSGEHRQIYERGNLNLAASQLVDQAACQKAGRLLDLVLRSNARTIQEVRALLLNA